MTDPVHPMPDVSSSETTALTQSVGHAIVWSQGLSIVRLAASLIFSVVVVRQLTPDEYGTYAFLMSFAASVSLLGSMGVDGLFGRYASQFQAKGETSSLAALLKGALSWRVGYLLVVGVGLTLAVSRLQRSWVFQRLSQLFAGWGC